MEMFNSLMYAKQLEDAGCSRLQAETYVQIMTEIIESNFATKQDLKDLSAELRQDMKALRHEMALLRSELVIKLGTIVSIAIGVAVTLARLI
jgi:hypothetical protein